MDHCISAFLQEQKQKVEDDLFKNYVTDCLKLLTENTAKGIMMTGQQGNYIANRYADIMNPKPKEPERKAEDIVKDIFERAGLKTKGEEVREENGSV